MHGIHTFISLEFAGKRGNSLRHLVISACNINTTPVYEERVPINHVFNVDLTRCRVLNAGVLSLNGCVLEVGAGTQAERQA